MIALVRQGAPHIPLEFLCSFFGVSRSGYYQSQAEGKSIRLVKKKDLCLVIRRIFDANRKTYGSPRIHAEMKAQGYFVSENTVAAYMREMGLDARLKRKYRVKTTDSNHSLPLAPRLVKTEDELTLPDAPGQVLAGDITYLNLGHRFLYLAIVIDLCSREVVGWSIQQSLHTKLVLDALEMAMKKLGPDVEVIFHSDQGSQYASEAYRKFCKEKAVIPSMSRRGNCYDNAYVESWFASFKKECLYRKTYSTEAELRAIAFDYIEVWYNRRRRHSSLGYVSPANFQSSLAAP